MKFTIYFFAFNIFFFSYAANSQDIPNVLDSLSFVMANVQDSYDATPFPEGHPQYREPRVDVVITFTVNNINNLKQVEIIFEKEKGKKNFKAFSLQHTISEGKSYLTVGNRFYPIVNGKVVIREQINAELMKRKIYFSVTATDKQNNKSNTLSRDFN